MKISTIPSIHTTGSTPLAYPCKPRSEDRRAAGLVSTTFRSSLSLSPHRMPRSVWRTESPIAALVSFSCLGPHVLSGRDPGSFRGSEDVRWREWVSVVDVRMGDRVGRFRGNASYGLVGRLVADCQGKYVRRLRLIFMSRILILGKG